MAFSHLMMTEPLSICASSSSRSGSRSIAQSQSSPNPYTGTVESPLIVSISSCHASLSQASSSWDSSARSVPKMRAILSGKLPPSLPVLTASVTRAATRTMAASARPDTTTTAVAPVSLRMEFTSILPEMGVIRLIYL